MVDLDQFGERLVAGGGRKTAMFGEFHVYHRAQQDDAPPPGGADIVRQGMGSDPASVAFDTVKAAVARGADVAIIDTAGRLHTSPELMRELAKVVNVTRKRATMPVAVILVIDATTGQNGLNQAREFNEALDIDGLIVTKLDGTAKGGIAVGISHELNLPIFRIGVGEGKDDLQTFDALEFCRALVGETEGI
jgi:fused signal recognition particle receptor